MSLQSFYSQGLGPCEEIGFDFGQRLTLLTGDNSVGKTLVLKTIFESLTGQLPDITPNRIVKPQAKRGAYSEGKGSWKLTLKRKDKETLEVKKWSLPVDASDTEEHKSLRTPHLVIYFEADGDISLIDHYRNQTFTYKEGGTGYHGFKKDKISKADLKSRMSKRWEQLCLQDSKQLDSINTFLNRLSDKAEECRANKVKLYSSQEAHRVKHLSDIDPEIELVFDCLLEKKVPLSHLSTGYTYLLSLCMYLHYYLLDTVRNHWNKKHLNQTLDIVILIDEAEKHLHVRWQRVLLKNLMTLIEKDLWKELKAQGLTSPSIQIIATTHSPLIVLGAVEGFDTSKDKFYSFQSTTDKAVRLTEIKQPQFPYKVEHALVSEIFGLKSTRSADIEALEHDLRSKYDDLSVGITKKQLDDWQNLVKTLPTEDPLSRAWAFTYKKSFEARLK